MNTPFQNGCAGSASTCSRCYGTGAAILGIITNIGSRATLGRVKVSEDQGWENLGESYVHLLV